MANKNNNLLLLSAILEWLEDHPQAKNDVISYVKSNHSNVSLKRLQNTPKTMKNKIAFMLFAIENDYFGYGSQYKRNKNGTYTVYVDGERTKYTSHALADEHDLLKHDNSRLYNIILKEYGHNA